VKGRALSERALIVLLAAIMASGPVSLAIYMPVVPLARAAFDVSVAAASTTVSAPLVAFAIGLFVYGPLSDHYGRRPVILAGLGIYLAGLALAIGATSIGMLTAGRVVAALGTSAGVTIARAIMGDLYARERMAHKLATLTMVMVTANALAPAAGGALAETFGWQAVFVVLLASGLLIAIAAWRWLPETRRDGGRSGGRGVLLATLTLLRDRAFLALALQSAVLYTVFFVFVAFVPYVFRNLGRSAAEYGLWYLIISVGYFLGNWCVSRYTYRYGVARMIGAGVTLQAVGGVAGWLLALGGFWHPLWIFLPWGVIGFAQGLALPNLMASGVARAPGHAGAASGLLGFSQQIVGAIAVQLMSMTPTSTPVPVTAFVGGCAAFAFVAHQLDARRSASAAGAG
jgi:DHA1 family bicyclomycin/chloramphenicol resistance-like MFS transporter